MCGFLHPLPVIVVVVSLAPGKCREFHAVWMRRGRMMSVVLLAFTVHRLPVRL